MTKFSPTDLLVLQRQLAEWCQTQYGRPRLPADVWGAAAALAHRHRPASVACTLGLSYPKLHTRPPRALRVRRMVTIHWQLSDAPPYSALHIFRSYSLLAIDPRES